MRDWLAYQAEVRPRHTALRFEGESWTFADLDAEAGRAAAALAHRGVGAGDRVAFLMSSSARFVQLLHALIRLRAVLVPLNSRLTAGELRWQLQDAEPRLLIYDREHEVQAHEALASASAAGAADVDAAGGTDCIPAGSIEPEAAHSIVYTSGTTGRPKGAQLTYGNHWWSAVGSALNLGTHRDDVWLACLPLFHVGGMSILMRSVIYGVPVVVQRSFDPTAVNGAIAAERITIVSVVAAMLQRMLREQAGRQYPAHLRCVLLGGGPAPKPLLEECAERTLPVVQTYGLTETASQAVTLAPEDALRKLGSAGKPLMPVQMRLLSGDREVAPRAEGEILLRGPNVSPGYWRNPDATAETFREGWLHTGDIGRLDSDGYLYVLERRSDLILSGGENVYPAEIEAVLLAHPAVADAGAAGVADPEWGQRVRAYVELRPGAQATVQELRDFCRQRLATYKVPDTIDFVDSLPRNAAGKLMRHKLKGL